MSKAAAKAQNERMVWTRAMVEARRAYVEELPVCLFKGIIKVEEKERFLRALRRLASK